MRPKVEEVDASAFKALAKVIPNLVEQVRGRQRKSRTVFIPHDRPEGRAAQRRRRQLAKGAYSGKTDG